MKKDSKAFSASLVFSVFIISVMIIASCQPPEPTAAPIEELKTR